MARPGRTLGAGGVLLLLLGCRVHVERVQVDAPLTPEDFHRVRVHDDTRKEVLEKLGPPAGVYYTLEDEVLEYRSARHRSTDLRFLVPLLGTLPVLSYLSPVEGVLRFLAPEVEEPEELPDHVFIASATANTLGFVSGVGSSSTSVSTREALALLGRTLRADVIRITLDRDDHHVRRKEAWFGVEIGRSESLLDAVFLQEQEGPEDPAAETPPDVGGDAQGPPR